MLSVSNLSLNFGKRYLFKDVNLTFTPGNCYGVIGANGAGKSTFLKILSSELQPSTGTVSLNPPKSRIAVLQQDQFAFDKFDVLQTVIMGHTHLYSILQERDALYAKADFSEADGVRSAELEAEVAELGGYEAESEAATLLSGLGIAEELHTKKMGELEPGEKVRVLLAQALFGNPDILLLDEPTNNLDLDSIRWLEDFLLNFENTVLVVSHDRHFLNTVCTHICDIDFGKISLYVGNYDFWYHASELSARQRKNENKRREEKVKELQDFIRRFSSNVSKARQATSRKKMLDKLTPEQMPQSSRKFPYIAFKPKRDCGKIVLQVEGLTKSIDGQLLFENLDLTVNRGDKIAFLGTEGLVKSTFFDVICGVVPPDSGTVTWGTTITYDYFPAESSDFFQSDLKLVDWLRQYSDDEEETYIRGFLGRMLFSGEESQKKVSVLSGGERVRCLLSKMMLSGSNVLVLDDPTNHLDLEAITALNDGLKDFSEVLLFTSHDHQFIETIANRIVEFTPRGIIDRNETFEEYLQSDVVAKMRNEHYKGQSVLKL